MLDLEKMRKELETKAELKYIKLHRKNQLHYYSYKNLDIVLRIDIITETVQYISITRKERQMNCTIVVEQKDSNKITTAIYTLDDYRVATAICNLLDNVVNVNKDFIRKAET